MLLAGHVIDAAARARDIAFDGTARGRRRIDLCGAGMLGATPVRWAVEPACMHAYCRSRCLPFQRNIARRILRIGQCPTLRDHPCAKIGAIHRAGRHQPVVTVNIAQLSAGLPPGNRLKRARGLSPAGPAFSGLCLTALTTFRRVDTKEPHLMPAYAQAVAINNRDAARKHIRRWGRQKARRHKPEQGQQE